MTPVWSILFNVVPVQFNVCSRSFGNTHHVRFITGALLKEATVALPFKTCCHREGCDVGSSLPSTASQKLAGSTEIWNWIAGFKVQSANCYTMEPSWSRGICPSFCNVEMTFCVCPSFCNVEMTQKEALRKAADPRASVWCRKSTPGSPLPKRNQELNIFSLTLSQLSYFFLSEPISNRLS